MLYLGEINSSQELAWRKSIEVLDEDAPCSASNRAASGGCTGNGMDARRLPICWARMTRWRIRTCSTGVMGARSSKIERILKINDLTFITDEVVNVARSTLVIRTT